MILPMQIALRVTVFAVGLAIVLFTARSVFTTLVVPRFTSSRMPRAVARGIGRVFRRIRAHLSTYEAKDGLMAIVGPLTMVFLFATWLLLLILGFGLMTW